MDKITNIVISALVAFVVVLGVGFFLKPAPTSPPVGALAGGDLFNQINEHAGEVNSTQLATTSNSTAETLTANEFAGWLNSSIVSYTPIGTAADTITLPASSTLTTVLQNAGDRQSFCFRNATSTAGVQITFAGGVGTTLLAASSTATAIGSKMVNSGKIACFTAIRQPFNTGATSLNIDVLMTAFQ